MGKGGGGHFTPCVATKGLAVCSQARAASAFQDDVRGGRAEGELTETNG